MAGKKEVVGPVELKAGFELVNTHSDGSALKAAFQGDGNFVVYKADKPIWNSVTHNKGGNRLCIQSDGNLVVYANETALWHTSTNGQGVGPYRLRLETDGSLALYDGTFDNLWSTVPFKAAEGEYGFDWQITAFAPDRTQLKAVFQSDGNFVLYKGSTAIWHANTQGKGATKLAVQGDGNLVVYAGSTPLWNTATNGKGSGPFNLRLYPSSALVLHDSKNNVLWQTSHAEHPSNVEFKELVNYAFDGSKLRAIFQSDGNLVLYKGEKALWHANTQGKGATSFNVQGDGNLVVYAGQTPLWNSETAGKGVGPYQLRLEPSSTLTLYDSKNEPLWTTAKYEAKVGEFKAGFELENHHRDGSAVRAVFQDDGNLVIYKDGKATWNAGTHGKGGNKFAIQGDGNLVIYHDSTPLWSSGTHGQGVGPYRLRLEQSGNLFLYDSHSRRLWQSKGE